MECGRLTLVVLPLGSPQCREEKTSSLKTNALEGQKMILDVTFILTNVEGLYEPFTNRMFQYSFAFTCFHAQKTRFDEPLTMATLHPPSTL